MMTATDSVLSMDTNSVDTEQRHRQTVSAYPPPTPLDLPQPGDARYSRQRRRSPSPLRSSHTPRSEDGSDQEDDPQESWGQRPQSPASSVTKFAAHFAQRVGSFMNASPAAGSASSLPSEAEIEAEAERERERGRREAERILAMERMKAENRMSVEQRVLAMLQSEQGRSASIPVPPRPQSTQPPSTPSPSTSQKESGGWWTTAKNKLTPTKDPLTPAQQIIQETKSREKEKEKGRKAQKKEKRNKSKDSETEWPASPERKYSDPTYMKLKVPQTPTTSQQRSSSPSSPSPLPRSNPPSLAASPLRGPDNKQPPPLYAQFSSDGVLDVPSTLLAIARRFEKLEKWTVSHVRALEERMDDVEKWLVEKEKEKEARNQYQSQQSPADSDVSQDISDIREEMTELQGRMSEIGREMAKLATSPHVNNTPVRGHQVHRVASSPSEIAVRSMTTSPTHSYPTASGQEPTSPPTIPPTIAPLIPTSSGSRTRLPYPTGDYATPPDTVILAQGHFASPPHSPPSSVLSSSVTERLSGLPTGLETPISNIPGLPGHNSPFNGPSPQSKVTSSPSLPPPKKSDFRHSSVSPTPRKRYTVALGGPIVDPDRRRNTPSPTPLYSSATDEESDDFQDFQEETVGKSSGRKVNLNSFDRSPTKSASKDLDKEPTRIGRPRPQSTYGAPTAPLIPRVRSRSTAGTSLGMDGDLNGSNTSLNKFIDPLVVRKQEREKETQQKAALVNPMAVRPGARKKAVKDLAAFFDGGEK